MKQIMIEGTLSIQSGDNPRIVKEKLSSYLAPSERAVLKDDGKD
jgi:chemotaxis protein MotA